MGVKVATTLFTYLYSLVQIMPAEPISYLKTQLLLQTKLSKILKIIKPKVGRSETDRKASLTH